MTKKEFLKSTYFKLLVPIIAIALVIALWQKGFAFGQWLYGVLH
jgi:fatty acid desaturase